MNQTTAQRKPQQHNGRPLARVEDGFMILNDGQMWDYDIPMRELLTRHGLNAWVLHLSEKTWFSRRMLDEMCDLVAKEARNA